MEHKKTLIAKKFIKRKNKGDSMFYNVNATDNVNKLIKEHLIIPKDVAKYARREKRK